LFGVGIFVGPTIGPTLGGFITEHYSWPWIFYINVPIGIIVAVISSRLIGEPRVLGRLSEYAGYFMTMGAGAEDARRQALGLLDSVVVRQSNALSFGNAYLLLGLVFLVCLPFLLLTSRQKGKKPHIALADH
jgi:MFS family permease